MFIKKKKIIQLWVNIVLKKIIISCLLSVRLGTTNLAFCLKHFIENVLKYACTLKKIENFEKIREKVKY